MTICIGVIVNDCMVFVADSASSHVALQDGKVSINRVYNGADKVFNLHRALPICAMTCGMGSFGHDSVATIAKGIRRDITTGPNQIDVENYTIEEVAKIAHERFTNAYAGLDLPDDSSVSFSFFVGGYNKIGNGNEVWKTHIANGKYQDRPVLLAGLENHGIIWDGQPEACIRLVAGYSTKTLETLIDLGIEPEIALKTVEKIALNSQAPLYDATMPTRDAIRLARFLAETTVGFTEFMPGANTVGGDLDVAVVTKYEGFRWIDRKHFYPGDLNQEPNHDR